MSFGSKPKVRSVMSALSIRNWAELPWGETGALARILTAGFSSTADLSGGAFVGLGKGDLVRASTKATAAMAKITSAHEMIVFFFDMIFSSMH